MYFLRAKEKRKEASWSVVLLPQLDVKKLKTER